MAAQQTKKARSGRPRLRPETVLDVVSLRMAPDEIELIRAAAAADGMKPSTWIRNAALGTAVLDPASRQEITTAGAATT